jgi:hypothetical protein
MSLLTARSVEEAHLYMDLRGAEPGMRGHRLVARGADLIAVYTAACHGEMRTFEFDVPKPVAARGLFGDEAPSTIIGPGEFLSVADRMSKSVPAVAEGLAPAQIEEARRRLRVAAACLDEIVKFVPAGHDRVPPSAFTSETDQEVYEREPGRFSKARLEAVAAAYRQMLSRYG